jgi:glycosyltransferase involved in cell wall biosynthesis
LIPPPAIEKIVVVTTPDISVVVPTYNRSDLMASTLRSLFSQRTATSSFEIVVVDNNSSDATIETVESFKTESPVTLRLIREPRQGNAYARNTGIDQAQGPIVAFLDDDVVADENWIRTIKATFDRDPQISFVGGRILPQWDKQPPSWLTQAHWAPLALLDYGGEEKRIAGASPPGLLTANIAIRRSVFDDVGRFAPDLQRVKGAIGSLEDHEFLLRMCRSGKTGLYVPDLITRAPVDPERISKSYHRRWHHGHGRFYARMRDPEWERSNFKLAGVPGHLYRETALNAVLWGARVLTGNTDAAFESECNLRFFQGFFTERRKKASHAD